MIALLLAGALSLLYSLLLTPLFIRLFRRLNWGQFIRDDGLFNREDGLQTHFAKRGTPTKGGIVFLSGAVIAYFSAKAITGEMPTPSALLVLMMAVGLGAIGFIDDFLKTRKQQSMGLGGWAKIVGQILVATPFALMSLQFANAAGVTPASPNISIFRDTSVSLFAWGAGIGIVLFVLWVIILVVSASNAVNVTDGLDGLAGGASILAIGAYALIGFWQFNQLCSLNPGEAGCYTVRDPLDLAVVAAALVGGLVGFLWWNTSPAQIYMGDTGSLGIGGAIAAFAILTRTELLLILIGGLFVIEAGSVVLQRIYFKLTRGKRIFLMSPIHHHFELKGWAEVTIVVRFWIIAAGFAIGAIGLFYAEWIAAQR